MARNCYCMEVGEGRVCIRCLVGLLAISVA